MADYIPPNISNISFTFSPGGYEKPDFGEVSFNSTIRPPSSSDIATIQASIEVMKLYQDETYTYTKECRTIVTGYSTHGIQTLKLPCVYGGIRDLGAYLVTQPLFLDLSADISVIFAYLDLATFQRASFPGQQDLSTLTRILQQGQKDIYGWFRPATLDTKDLGAYTKFVKGVKIPVDLGAYLQDVQPIDISAYTNVIEIRNLISSIEGIYLKGEASFAANFHRLLYRSSSSFGANLFGWASLDLNARITSFWSKDLGGEINAGFFAIHRNLGSLISCITPVDLGASMHGYATFNLSAFTIQAYQPNDIQALLNSVKPKDLSAQIYALFGTKVPFNLLAYISGVYKRDLAAYIGVNAAKNLIAYIDAVGKYKDLEARIAPRTINIKRMLLVPLFEHKDLRATIQYSCMRSSYLDLPASMYLIHKKDLKGYIIGWYSGQADNLIDLTAYINVSDRFVYNYITVAGIPHIKHSSPHDVVGEAVATKRFTFNTHGLFRYNAPAILTAYITGQYESINLSASLVAKPISNFTTVPDWIKPSTHEVVINLKRFEERWVRFVEMMFFTNSHDDYHYFYVSGEDKIYKVDRNRTWQIYLTGYTEEEDSIYNRKGINKKFIFNLKNYNTVDDAITDLIDRVSTYRISDLYATITAYDLDHTDLYANIKVKFRSSWSSSLLARAKALVSASNDLASSIYPVWLQDSNNLTASIVGRFYEPPDADNVKLIFEDPGYVAPAPYSNMNWTYKQAEKFWIYDEE